MNSNVTATIVLDTFNWIKVNMVNPSDAHKRQA